MANSFVHVELNTTDVNGAKTFYGKLFDWTLEDVPTEQMTYTTVEVGNGPGGGTMTQLIPGAGSFWLPYVEIADIKGTTQETKTLGGMIMRDVTDVMGWLSIITDPTGAVLGLWQGKE
jgi:uncharacterized protein